MANLDELVVKIKGDIRDFKKKMDGASTSASKTMKKMRGAFKGIRGATNDVFDGIVKFRGAIAGLAAAGGLATMAKASLDSADAIGKLSKNTGVGTGLLQELSFAASQTGVSQNDLNASLLRFNRRIADAAAGSAEFKKGFDSLGVPLQKANGELRSTEEILFDVADGVKELNSDNERASALFKVFGDSGFKLVNLFKNGSPALKTFAEKANDLGIVIEEGMIQNAEDANDQLDILQKVISAKFTKAVVEAAPAITSLSEGIVGLIEGASKAFQIFDRGTKTLSNLALSAYAALTGNEGLKKGLEELEQQELDAEYARQQSLKGTKRNTEAEKARKEALKAATKALEEKAQLEKDVAKLLEKTGETGASQIEKELEMLRKAKSQKLANQDELNRAIMTKEQELADFKAQKNAEEIEKNFEKIELLKEMDNEDSEARIEALVEDIERRKEIMGEFEGFKTDARLKDVKEEQETAKKKNKIDKWLASEKGKNFQDTMSFIQQGSRSGNKELAWIAKQAATAQAIIDTYAAANKALAQGGILGPALATLVTAVGVANVSRIQSTPIALQSGATDVPGIGRGDRVPALLEPQERVVDRNTNQDLKSFLKSANGGGGGVARVELSLKGDLAEMIEADIVERQRVGISVLRS